QHLQPMLHHAQENVGLVELDTYRLVDPAARDQSLQHRPGPRAAQRRVASPGNELLRLGEELYLADAAAAALDVVSEHADGRYSAMRLHLALDGMDVGDRRVVEVFAPYERRQLVQEGAPGLLVSGADARLDEGRALPV